MYAPRTRAMNEIEGCLNLEFWFQSQVLANSFGTDGLQRWIYPSLKISILQSKERCHRSQQFHPPLSVLQIRDLLLRFQETHYKNHNLHHLDWLGASHGPNRGNNLTSGSIEQTIEAGKNPLKLKKNDIVTVQHGQILQAPQRTLRRPYFQGNGRL